MGESSARQIASSSLRGGKYATKKIQPSGARISFRALAKLASPRKTEQFLAGCTGKHPRTAKRWLSGDSRAPAGAVYAVLADILGRID